MSERYEVSLMSKAAIAPGVTEVIFDISKTNFRFTAGQYATITLPNATDQPTTSQFHDFSIASSPNDHEKLKIAFRNSASYFKTTLLNLPLGGTVILEGPSGNFTLPEETDRPIVCIAGGIGVTPFMSMLTAINEMKQDYKVTLFYSNRDSVSTAYASDIQQLSKLNPAIKIVFTMTNDHQWKGETKAIEGDFVKSYLGDLSKYIFYIAGPPVMVFAVRDDLRQAGVAEADIHTEGFTGIEVEQVLTGSDYNAIISSLDQTALVSMTDDKGHIVYANQKFVEASKYPAGELMGQNHRLLKSGAQPQETYTKLWDDISHGRVWHGEMKNKAKDNTYYWVDKSIAPVMGAGERPERYVSVDFLITDRKERELTLQKANAIDEAILSSINEALVAVDRDGKIILVNQAYEKLLGWNAKEILHTPIQKTLLIRDEQGGDVPAHDTPLHKVLTTGKAVLHQHNLIHKNGDTVPTTISATPIILDGEVIGVVQLFRATTPNSIIK